MLKNYKELKSGSDIRGTALEGGGSRINLTDEAITDLASGFAVWLSEKKRKENLTVAIGRDSRLSGQRIANAVKRALNENGVNVLDCGYSSTPAMFMITVDKEFDVDGSIEITASHHPFDKNGLKFFVSEGGLEGSDISKIIEYAENQKTLVPLKRNRSIAFSKPCEFMDKYAQLLVNLFREKTGQQKPLENLKIIVDAGNGVGGFYVEKVLKPLGANTEGSQFLEPDGNFPNHTPNPENKEAMKSVCQAVLKSKADFGIIFDTDVDRAGAVDKNGNEINRNRLIALISAILLKEQNGSIIVTDSVTSDGLAEFILANGGVHHRFKRGYKNVINEAIRLEKEGKNAPLAIETSGHAALKENYFLDDGAYLVTRILISYATLHSKGKDLLDLISGLKMPIEESEVRLGFNESNFLQYGNAIIEDIKEFAKNSENISLAEINYEGARISFDENCGDGFVLIRMSVHDPIMPINAESNQKGGVKIMLKTLYDVLKKYEGLNLENLQKLI